MELNSILMLTFTWLSFISLLLFCIKKFNK